MCGRCRCTLRADDIPRACHIDNAPIRYVNMVRYHPSYNISPGSNLPVLHRDDEADGQGVVLHCMKWGLIPSFTKKSEKPDHFKMFNARSESITEKASFRRLVPRSRCLVAVEGFYEWKKDGSKKQPYYIHLKDGRPMLFAALYDSWKDSEGETLYTFTILTTSSSSSLQWLHDRMPVILPHTASTDTWLNGSSTKFNLLLKPYEAPDLVWYPVTPSMGKPSFSGPECIQEIKLKSEEKNPISKFFSPKGGKIDQDLQSMGKLSQESVATEMQKSVKEEPEPEGDKGIQQEGGDSKTNVSFEGATRGSIKREHGELHPDLNPPPPGDETDKLTGSPPWKKGNFNNAGDKQPTLFSYFGRR